MMRALDSQLGRLETAIAYLAAIIMLLIVVIVSSDVVMRYVFNRPFIWAYDLVALYLMAALFYLSLSKTFAVNAHIGVDILQYHMSERLRRLCQTFVCAVSTCVFAMVSYVSAGRAFRYYIADAVSVGAILWPSWISAALAAFGAGLITLRLMLNTVAHGIALSGGEETISLPPLSYDKAAGGDAGVE